MRRCGCRKLLKKWDSNNHDQVRSILPLKYGHEGFLLHRIHIAWPTDMLLQLRFNINVGTSYFAQGFSRLVYLAKFNQVARGVSYEKGTNCHNSCWHHGEAEREPPPLGVLCRGVVYTAGGKHSNSKEKFKGCVESTSPFGWCDFGKVQWRSLFQIHTKHGYS